MQIRTIAVLRSEESSEKVSRETRRNNHEFAATINSTDFNNAKKRQKHLLQTVKSEGKIQPGCVVTWKSFSKTRNFKELKKKVARVRAPVQQLSDLIAGIRHKIRIERTEITVRRFSGFEIRKRRHEAWMLQSLAHVLALCEFTKLISFTYNWSTDFFVR